MEIWQFIYLQALGTSQYTTDNSRGSGDGPHVVVDGTGDITGFDTDTGGNRTRGVIETFGFMSKNPSVNHHKVIVFTIQMYF